AVSVGDEAEDVHPHARAAGAPRGGPPPGQAPQAGGLLRGDRFEGVAEPGRPAGLHLADDVPAAVVGDDVDLAVVAPPVALDDRPAESGQVFGGRVLAAPAETDMGSHGLTSGLRSCRSVTLRGRAFAVCG